MLNRTDSFTTASVFHCCSAKMAEMSDSEEELFLEQSSLNGWTNRGDESEKFVSSNNRQEDYQNCQFNIEEATEGLFSFDHSDEHQKVSIGRVENKTKANNKKASKRDILVVYACWPGTVTESQRTLKR